MNIQPIQHHNIAMQGKMPPNSFTDRVMQKILDTIPERTFEESARKLDKWEKIDNVISRPVENRAILAVTALFAQPLIAECNFKVDKETRRIDRNRKIAVATIPALVGIFIVRGPVSAVVNSMTNLKGNSRLSQALLPKEYLSEIHSNPKFLKNYRSALTMAIALFVMLYTNFKFDAPWTADVTNWLNENDYIEKFKDKIIELKDKIFGRKPKEEAKNEI